MDSSASHFPCAEPTARGAETHQLAAAMAASGVDDAADIDLAVTDRRMPTALAADGADLEVFALGRET